MKDVGNMGKAITILNPDGKNRELPVIERIQFFFTQIALSDIMIL